MASGNESFELRSFRDKHAPQDDTPPPYIACSHGISRSSLLLGLYIVIPALTTVSAITLGLKSFVATRSASGLRAAQFLDKEGSMSQWPSTLFPNQHELPLVVAALALATAVFVGILLLIVVRNGHLQVWSPHEPPCLTGLFCPVIL
ncbi:hypothetical protein IMZ48_02215 [Candidatus Bathyarchaeota archaeon]|nr:hypothetical protein [Candidatus Bathyarchaeota archaeon]